MNYIQLELDINSNSLDSLGDLRWLAKIEARTFPQLCMKGVMIVVKDKKRIKQSIFYQRLHHKSLNLEVNLANGKV